MKKTYLILAGLLALLFFLNLAKPSFINRIRPRIIDFMEFPLKAVTVSTRTLYNFATFQNRYEKRISMLEGEIAVLKNRAVQTKEVLSENERFRSLLSFKSRLASKAIAAEVIARDQSSWDAFIIIDKGKRDGMRTGMSVATSYGLIGRVFEVGQGTAKIILIDNPNSKIGAIAQRTREQGVLVGIGGGLCKLTYLSCDTGLRRGDVIIARQMSDLSTKGILIGEVIKVFKEAHSLYASAVIKPASNLFKIEEVVCIE
jgi:rod shape-determining protein MreC